MNSYLFRDVSSTSSPPPVGGGRVGAVAMGNNPVSRVDPDGLTDANQEVRELMWETVLTFDGKILGRFKSGSITISDMDPIDDWHGQESNDIANTIWGQTNYAGEVAFWDEKYKAMTVNVSGGPTDDNNKVEKFLKDSENKNLAIKYLKAGSPHIFIITTKNKAFETNKLGMVKSVSGDVPGYTDPAYDIPFQGKGIAIFLAPCNFFEGNFFVMGATLYHEIQHAYDIATGVYSRLIADFGKSRASSIRESRAQEQGYRYYTSKVGYEANDYYSKYIYESYRKNGKYLPWNNFTNYP